MLQNHLYNYYDAIQELAPKVMQPFPNRKGVLVLIKLHLAFSHRVP